MSWHRLRPCTSTKCAHRVHRPHLELLEARTLLASHVVINEIMYHPAGDDASLEFVELFNAGSREARLNDWEFTAGIEFAIPDVTLLPRAYLAVAADVASFQSRHPDVVNVVGGWSGRLANRGEGITLRDSTGRIVDQVRYADQGDWALRVLQELDNGHRGWGWVTPSDGEGKSLELTNAALPNDVGHSWRSSLVDDGTPGRANSTLATNVAPLIVDVAHLPVVPTSSDAVVVTARIHDEAPAAVSATLSYRQDTEATPFTEVSMNDAGTGSDRVAGDGLYSAMIPPLPATSIVEFRVEATDAEGNRRVVPAFETDDPARSANRLYQVLDDQPTVDNWDPRESPITYLVMTAAERAALRDIGDGPLLEAQSDAQMNATYIRVDGNGIDVRYNVGVRNRGGASRIGPPNNYRVNLVHDAPLDGAVSINLNSRFTHAQLLGSAIYRLARLPAAEAVPMRVRVNGEDLSEAGGPRMFGFYAQLETVTGSFPDRYFPEDRRGNLYRAIESGTESGDLRYEGPLPAAYQDTYSKRTNEEDDDWSDLIELVNVLNNAPEATFLDEVDRVLDVEQWLRYLALDALLGNLETGLNVGRGDNFWLYRGTVDQRFKLIPHDLDTILGRGRVGQPNRNIFSYTATPGLQRFLTHEAIVPRYYQTFLELIEEVYNPETLFPLLDHLVGYLPAAELQAIKQFVIDRIAGVQAQLPDEFVATSDLPRVQGMHRTTIPAASVFGVANAIETKSVLVNGLLADWSPLTGQWSIETTDQGTTRTLVEHGAVWRYLDDGSNLQSWTTASFDDTRWTTGAAPLGYGEGDEQTVISFGPNPADKFVTTYFRHEFSVENANEIVDLSLQLERDDGAIVYLNGQEIVRSNMPSGTVDFQTVASSWIGGGIEGQVLSFAIDPSLLRSGQNVLAVEVHQLSGFDEDLRFDLALEASFAAVEDGVPLNPGLNRLVVEAFDEPDGQGSVVDRGFVDIWYDGASRLDQNVCGQLDAFGVPAAAMISGGALTRDTVLAPCSPAYRVTGGLVVPEGVRLTVLPGTTVFFEQGAGITVEGGELVAVGEPYRQIRFTKAPEATGSWNGIQFVNSMMDNRISHAVLEHATTEAGMVGLRSSNLVIEQATFDHSDLFRIHTVDSSLVVRDSTFTDMFPVGAPPLSDNGSEHIKGSGIASGGQFILEGNYFGTTSGHNDAIDFDGAVRPDPIPVILDNMFAGSGDDAIDLESDAHIEGNVFRNIVKDQYNTSTGDANAISAGAGREYVVVRNTFYNVDHAVQVKDGAFLHFQNNTVANVHISPIYFDLPDRSPGKGAVVEDSIFVGTPLTLGAADQAEVISVERSIVTSDALQLGTGNSLGDPRLADPAGGDFGLRPGSAAKGIGQDGRDVGAVVPAGLSVSGEPPATTGQNFATLHVNGPGMTHYRYRVNGVSWSDEFDIDEPIQLQKLADAVYQVELVGRDSAGRWQDDAYATRSESWTVDTSVRHLWISELLASNDGAVTWDGGTPDLIELYNDGAAVVDLSGMRITDNPADRTRFVFPAGTTVGPGEYLVLQATAGTGLRTGFRLDADGEGVYLYDRPENGGRLIDAVEFGIQIPDLSISRIGHSLQWQLSKPTFGSANVRQPLGDQGALRINEWLADASERFAGDFLELYNGDRLPVELSGLFLSDDPVAQPRRHEIRPLSFISGHGFALFELNANLNESANPLPFGIAADGETIAILDEQLRPIDVVMILAQTTDRSQGRVPDGSDLIAYPLLGTPGGPNPTTVTSTVTISPWDAVWSYDQSGSEPIDTWPNGLGDDPLRPTGAGPFGVVNGQAPFSIGTPLETGVLTYYLWREVEIDAAILSVADPVFELSMWIDDGAALYINGVEVVRLGLPDGPLTSQTAANRGVGLAAVEGPFHLPAELFKAGSNIIAAEVHQISRLSSDVAFGATLTVSTTFTYEIFARAIALLQGLRISELMYHPAGDADTEFIELTNITDVPLQLAGVRIGGGVDISLPDVLLTPGQHVVVVRDEEAFRARYGAEIRVVGEYAGALSNGGEELILSLPAPFDGPFDSVIQRFHFSDAWHEETDGAGYSLEITDVLGSLGSWNLAAAWRPSEQRGGSPGRVNGAEPSRAGDFNSDGVVDHQDVDLLIAAISRQSTNASPFDLTRDQMVDEDDLTFLVESLIGSRRGDADLDRDVDFADFLILASNFGLTSKPGWAAGDFNANGHVDFGDFLLLSGAFE